MLRAGDGFEQRERRGSVTDRYYRSSDGHRRPSHHYKQELQRAEGLVHGITIACGIASWVLPCAAYERPAAWIPALVLTLLPFIYSLVDEALHWLRHVRQHSDRVEMWSHVGILVGHGTRVLGWWTWLLPRVSRRYGEDAASTKFGRG